MIESNQTTCKKCNQIKYRIQKGYFKNGRDKRWVDDNDRQWVGHTCPDCNNQRVKSSYHDKVSEKAKQALVDQAQELNLGYQKDE